MTTVILGSQQEADERASTEITQRYHKEFKDVFTGIEYFDGTLQRKPEGKAYKALKACSLHLTKLFKEELEWLEQWGIITQLGVDEMMKWCNSFVLVSKPNGRVRLWLDPARLNQALT